MGRIARFRWNLDDDGAGTVSWWGGDANAPEQQRQTFDSVGEMPKGIAQIIREDGRRVGEYPPADEG